MPENTRTEDPLIDEVRAVRKAISDRFGNDVGRLCEHLRQVQREHGGTLVDRSTTHNDEPTATASHAP